MKQNPIVFRSCHQIRVIVNIPTFSNAIRATLMSSALGALLHSRLVAEHHNTIVLGGADVELVVNLNKRDKWNAIFTRNAGAMLIFSEVEPARNSSAYGKELC